MCSLAAKSNLTIRLLASVFSNTDKSSLETQVEGRKRREMKKRGESQSPDIPDLDRNTKESFLQRSTFPGAGVVRLRISGQLQKEKTISTPSKS